MIFKNIITIQCNMWDNIEKWFNVIFANIKGYMKYGIQYNVTIIKRKSSNNKYILKKQQLKHINI